MTPVQGAAGDAWITVPPCRKCNRRLGAKVEYCPFCGAGQRPPPGQSETVSPVSLVSNQSIMPVVADAGISAPGADSATGKGDALASNDSGTPMSDPGPNAAEVPDESASGPPPISQWQRTVSALKAIFALARAVCRHRTILAIPVLAIWLVVEVAMPAHENRIPLSPTGTVTVIAVLPNGMSDNSGTILVAGQAAGPPGVALRQPAGPVVIGYASPGWSVTEQKAVIVAGADTEVRLNLKPVPANLHVATVPVGADLLIDGQAFGRTPADVTLSAGRHELTISRQGYAPKSVTLSLESGEDLRRSFDLAQVQPPQITAPPFNRGVTTGATSLRSAPSPGAETVQTIDADEELPVVGQVMVEGRRWLAARYTDGRTVFLPPESPFVPWSEWAALKKLSGTITGVLRGYRLVIGAKTIPLYGIRPPDPLMKPAASLAYEKNLNSLGGALAGRMVECEPYRVRLYTCFVDHRDTAELFLLNGAAVVDTDSTPEYIEMQRQAAENHRGLAQ
jgi:endonuclease YncB( thermonuclease family)